MDREILFRGFYPCIDGNKTIYIDGKEKKGKWIDSNSLWVETVREEFLLRRCGAWYQIISETLGQYTGLKDKNGTMIFEGDIVIGEKYPFIDEGKQNYVGIVEYYIDIAQFAYTYKCVNKNKRGISDGINNEFEANNDLILEELEVIGNIFENPELLEVKKEET